MKAQRYDLIVIGGGIHGVGVAQAAAAAGYSILLVEKTAIGSGTSCKSSKLIHGGLRYLESFQLSLVRECLTERAILLKNAPALVKMIPFYIPIYKTTTRRPWKISAGLSLYNVLSGINSPYHKIPKNEWLKLDSLIQKDLDAVYQYNDAQTDDVLLTRAVMDSAKSLGAEILTPATFVGCEVHKKGCNVRVKTDGKEQSYECDILVNAAGSSVNDVLNNCQPVQAILPFDSVQGAHILLNVPEKKGVYYMESVSDRRAVFAMPWKGHTLVGTTETKINALDEQPLPSSAEIEYLLEVYNTYFSNKNSVNSKHEKTDAAKEDLTITDVLESFAGVRVLPRGKQSLFSRSRDTVLLADSTSNPRVLTLYGGKLTAYRSTAEKALKRVRGNLPLRKFRADTKSLRLTE